MRHLVCRRENARRESVRVAVGRDGWGERGQGLAEYLIIVVVIAVAVILAIRYYGGSLSGQIQNATDEVSSARRGVDREASSGTAQPSGKSEGGKAEESEQTLPSSGKAASESGIRESSGSIEKQVHALRPAGMGDEEEVVDSFNLDLPLLIGIGAVVIAVGVAVVFLTTKEKRKEKKEKKKKKKKLFSRDNEGAFVRADVLWMCFLAGFSIFVTTQAPFLSAENSRETAAKSSSAEPLKHCESGGRTTCQRKSELSQGRRQSYAISGATSELYQFLALRKYLEFLKESSEGNVHETAQKKSAQNTFNVEGRR